MQLPHWLILTALHASLCFSFAVIPRTSPTTNLSAIPDLPDHRFDVRYSYLEPPLNIISCQMIILTAMRELSLMDINDEISEPAAKAWKDASYPGVIVMVSAAHRSAGASVRFAMWTLYNGMRDTLTRNQCRRTFYIGIWEGREVVNVYFLPDLSALATQNQTEVALHHDEQLSSPDNATVARSLEDTKSNFSFSPHLLNTKVVGSDELHADITYRGQAIDSRDIFMTVTWIMLRLAPVNKQAVGVFGTSEKAITTEVRTIFNRAAGVLPYIMTSGDLISLLAFLPGHLLQEKKWQEMDIVISDNEHAAVVIARGIFRLGSGLLEKGIVDVSVETF
ncbi:MAG: hypothetical protein Q9170_002353 [Blastenia crenularia]